MLKPHPVVLRRLVEEYEALAGAETPQGPAGPNPRLRDLAYTLCVSTGTRDVRHALETAHRWLGTSTAAARPRPAALAAD
ncbi:DUF5133 domain-containing protein [Streptomyces sp. SID9913]|uniref:DUF5133 domain-containing protein n=1 Tax=unclassified Streptomyces TaxID=2593676 RepID=UPI0013DA4752|nr:DUF5133 domain-containing protein [Streptomyces sp. SID9913]NED18965.1 DUF5133 domain-containing protein [Streptomyces sp. SID9913]